MTKKLNHTVVFDGTPVFRGLALALHQARKHGWKGRLLSADRRKGVAEKYGKMSQAFLSAAWVAWSVHHILLKPFTAAAPPNPANSPGHSTHELRSDAVAYRGPVGRPLAWWQLGLDVSEAEELLQILRSLGYGVRRPYPSGSEEHHLNLTRNPRRQLRKWGLIHDPHKATTKPTVTSKDGVHLIAGFEGWVNHVYLDAVKIPTIGYGHVVRPGEHFPATISKQRGLALLADDLRSAERSVQKLVKVALTQHQFDALVSFVFNLGAGALASSTLLRDLNKRQYHAAADEFLKWDHAGGHVLAGLTRRRREERALFLHS